MNEIFYVSGYWKDDKEEFNSYIVCSYDEVPEGLQEEDIFFFGLSEEDLTELVEKKEDTVHDFVVTFFYKD